MSSYDTLYDEAAENYGLITTEMAGRYGISGMSLVMLERRGRLRRVGRGVYRLEQHPVSEYDGYAALVARAGKEAFLWGPTVLAMENLCPTDPATLYVAVPRRLRRKLGRGVVVCQNADMDGVTLLNGIRSQSVAAAIRASRGIVMDDRLREAVVHAAERGLVRSDESRTLKRELKHVG